MCRGFNYFYESCETAVGQPSPECRGDDDHHVDVDVGGHRGELRAGGREKVLCRRVCRAESEESESLLLCGSKMSIPAILGGGERRVQESMCHRVLSFLGLCACMNTLKYLSFTCSFLFLFLFFFFPLYNGYVYTWIH